MNSPIRNKYFAISAVIMIVIGVERIVEWYFYGYSRQQSHNLPEATGIHALVTGVVIVALGTWMAFSSTRKRSSGSTSASGPKASSKLNR